MRVSDYVPSEEEQGLLTHFREMSGFFLRILLRIDYISTLGNPILLEIEDNSKNIQEIMEEQQQIIVDKFWDEGYEYNEFIPEIYHVERINDESDYISENQTDVLRDFSQPIEDLGMTNLIHHGKWYKIVTIAILVRNLQPAKKHSFS